MHGRKKRESKASTPRGSSPTLSLRCTLWKAVQTLRQSSKHSSAQPWRQEERVLLPTSPAAGRRRQERLQESIVKERIAQVGPVQPGSQTQMGPGLAVGKEGCQEQDMVGAGGRVGRRYSWTRRAYHHLHLRRRCHWRKCRENRHQSGELHRRSGPSTLMVRNMSRMSRPGNGRYRGGCSGRGKTLTRFGAEQWRGRRRSGLEEGAPRRMWWAFTFWFRQIITPMVMVVMGFKSGWSRVLSCVQSGWGAVGGGGCECCFQCWAALRTKDSFPQTQKLFAENRNGYCVVISKNKPS